MAATTARPVLGLQGTVDFEVDWDPDAIGALASANGITLEELDRMPALDDQRGLLVSLLSHLRAGRGGEVAVDSTQTVLAFAASLRYTVTLGGTGVRAGLVLARRGLASTVHLVSTDEHVRALLPAEIEVVSSADHDTLDPHLILQYPAGATIAWDGNVVTAPQPNRVIFTDDPPARELVLSPRLGDALAEAPVFLLSGLNALPDEERLHDRVATLRSAMQRMRADAVVLYEDAGFHVPALGGPAVDALHGCIDVYSLNEDELESRIGRPVLLDDPHDVAEAVRSLRALAPGPTLVLHTRYFAAAIGLRAGDVRTALEGGVLAASARFVHGDAATPGDAEALAAGVRSEVGRGIDAALPALLDEPVVVVPALDLRVPSPTTIGLGDTFVGGFVAALVAAPSRV
jgi:ADP-dependent phosphofructokinase/glucokinase